MIKNFRDWCYYQGVLFFYRLNKLLLPFIIHVWHALVFTGKIMKLIASFYLIIALLSYQLLFGLTFPAEWFFECFFGDFLCNLRLPWLIIVIKRVIFRAIIYIVLGGNSWRQSMARIVICAILLFLLIILLGVFVIWVIQGHKNVALSRALIILLCLFY